MLMYYYWRQVLCSCTPAASLTPSHLQNTNQGSCTRSSVTQILASEKLSIQRFKKADFSMNTRNSLTCY